MSLSQTCHHQPAVRVRAPAPRPRAASSAAQPLQVAVHLHGREEERLKVGQQQAGGLVGGEGWSGRFS